ncbi:hypothetical protein WMR86_17275 [Proteus vulgaris]|uniref:DUF6950 domain-containing protein n=1 Tax=Proteus penneri TaxID=102862 RepID=A0A0G4Q934_9GAMM|nr:MULTISPECIES: hypothetical protein [Proteus]UXA35604.1 hypothetical protein KZA80_06735 [Proteus terrae]CRL62413.1 hypothetical protein BN1804_01939 [Proteus penneri]
MKQPNWTLQLPETIRAAMSRPFSWGEFDCCIFASECIYAQCGFSPIKLFLGQYKTKAAAFNLIKSKFGSLDKAVSHYFKSISVDSVQRGDLVMFKGDDGDSMAVVWAGNYWGVTSIGVRPVQINPIKAWRVE